ncbi:TonB-dependent receptor [Bryobacter aggregatus]|uniref:TonB-dependent receptor n=1 Tax=Bryobacter aggregatus TaxID=360054 RepID=UPI0004E180D7|nr:carboxypeptidase-like regulatory domain-containing protein [Bryobacter aggregatus]
MSIATMLFCAAAIFGQTLGDAAGTVQDPQGAPVTGANVSITNLGTNATRSTVTNDQGLYAFPALVPGIYSIKVDAGGFKSYSRTNLEIQVQASIRVDVTMQLGERSEIVEVNASAAVLQTENATVGTVVEQKRIVELPLNGRNYLSLAGLAPNVSAGFSSAGQADGRQGGDRANQNISVAGMRNNFNRFTLDGVENTDPNFNTYVINPSAEALQEFKVQTGVYPAEFGRGATQINVSTKSGGNQYHGAVYEFLRNDKLDSKNYRFTGAERPKDPFKWNQFGFMLSGPVQIPKLFDGKNRLFFMTNYEWFRQRRNVTGSYSVPTDAFRSGNFSALSGGIYDPLTRAFNADGTVASAQLFPNNTIPSNRFDATGQKLLKFYPVANVPGPPSSNYITALGRPINKDQFIQRFDWVESSKSSWFGRYSRSDENQSAADIFQNGSKIVTLATQWTATNTRVLTNMLVNEFRFGFSSFYNTNGPELAFTRDVVAELAIPGLSSGPAVQWGIPNIAFNNTYSGFGNSSEGPYENKNKALQFINNLSWVRGRHNFKFGGEVRRDEYNQVGNQFARGQFTFDRVATSNPALTGVTGDSFADFLLGNLYQSEAAVSIAKAEFRSTGFAFYIDDVWRVNSKLTVNMGLRYENTPPWEDQTGTLFNGIVRRDIKLSNPFAAVVQDRSLYPYFMRQSPARQNCYEGINIRWVDIETKCDGSLGSRLVQRDNNDWAPRLGISYQLTPKTVVRLGSGAFYSQDTGNPRFDMARNLAGRLRSNSSRTTPNLLWANALGAIAGGVANVPTPYTFANPYDRRTPYTIQYLMNVQHEFTNNLVLEAGYLGSFSRHLESLRAVNEAVPVDPAVSNLSVPNRSAFPNFGRIQLVDNSNHANYNSLGAKLTKRYSAGLTALFSYTWSKSIDTASAIRNQGGDTLFPQNSGCRNCERGLSSFNTQHRFVTSLLYDLPVGKGRMVNVSNGFADALVGGWQVGSIFTAQSGFPITVTNSTDISNTGALFDRPNATGISPQVSGVTTERAFNTAAFSLAAPGTYGNVGRNTFVGPNFYRWEFTSLKNFQMPYREGHVLQFRFEAFNLPNHPNWGNPDTNIQSANFGRIRGTRGDMRNLQVALRYTF